MSEARHQFGAFSFDPATLELWRAGQPVPIEPQPARLLALLIDREGTLVTPHDIRRQLWPDGSYVDFDRGVRYAVGHVRRALGKQQPHRSSSTRWRAAGIDSSTITPAGCQWPPCRIAARPALHRGRVWHSLSPSVSRWAQRPAPCTRTS